MDLQLEIFDNAVMDWLAALGVALVINAAVALVKAVTLRRLGATAVASPSPWDDVVVHMLRSTRQGLVLLVTFYVGSRWLDLPERVDQVVKFLATVGFFAQLGAWLNALLACFMERSRKKSANSQAGAATSLATLNLLGRFAIWSAVALLLLANLGVDVTALVAGLGIGGVAVALALQNILGDLFASLSIVMDKPFVIGDFIVVDEYMGTVEHVGVKTTRVRSLSGEQIVFSNGDLLKSRLRNHKRMRERRIAFTFGLLYDTPTDKLRGVPDLVRRIIDAQPMTRFERAHFLKLAESSLDFEVVYWMLDPDYNLYMDTQQAINLGLMEAVAADGMGFAFPTRTLQILREDASAARPAPE